MYVCPKTKRVLLICVVASSRWSYIESIWQTLIMSTQMWWNLPKWTSHAMHWTSDAIVRCRKFIKPINTFRDLLLLLITNLQHFGEIKEQPTQHENTENRKNAFRVLVLSVRCEGVLQVSFFLWCVFAFMEWNIHSSSKFHVVRPKIYVVFIIAILKETHRRKKNDKINTNCPVATWIYGLTCVWLTNSEVALFAVWMWSDRFENVHVFEQEIVIYRKTSLLYVQWNKFHFDVKNQMEILRNSLR